MRATPFAAAALVLATVAVVAPAPVAGALPDLCLVPSDLPGRPREYVCASPHPGGPGKDCFVITNNPPLPGTWGNVGVCWDELWV